MARSSLSNSSSKLNLSRRQTALFQKIIIIGNKMADFLNHFETRASLPNSAIKLSRRWSYLMVQLAKKLL